MLKNLLYTVNGEKKCKNRTLSSIKRILGSRRVLRFLSIFQIRSNNEHIRGGSSRRLIHCLCETYAFNRQTCDDVIRSV